jgi:DNA-binding XRE family transcriptional regulator
MSNHGKPTPEQANEIRRKIAEERPRIDAWARDVAAEAAALGRKLREVRESCGVSLARMAELSGMDKSSLSHLENGHRSPSFDTITRYARALGKRVDLVFDDAA